MRNVIAVLVAAMVVMAIGVGGSYASGDQKAATPTLSVKAMQNAVKPGDMVTVELYISMVSDLSVYQFAVGAKGGEQGALKLEEIIIDQKRPGYVFAGGQVIAAPDIKNSRAGALIMGVKEGRNVSKPTYIATAKFRVSGDAKGTFDVNLVAGQETFLRNSKALAIDFKIAAPAKVTVAGRASATRVIKRD